MGIGLMVVAILLLCSIAILVLLVMRLSIEPRNIWAGRFAVAFLACMAIAIVSSTETLGPAYPASSFSVLMTLALITLGPIALTLLFRERRAALNCK